MDEQERHFIGDLLSNEDDSFAPKTPTTTNNNNRESSSCGGGVGGRPPSSRYWPEPPPPYTESPPQWAALKQPGGASPISYHPYSFHSPHPHPHPQSFPHHQGGFITPGGPLPHPSTPMHPQFPPHPTHPHHLNPHLPQPNMVLTQSATVPSNTFQVHLPPGTVLTPATHIPSSVAHITSGQWDSIYTPFGGPQTGGNSGGLPRPVEIVREREEERVEPPARSPREKSPTGGGEGGGGGQLPKAGKSYRDVASAKPPIHPGSSHKRMDSPTLRGSGELHHQYSRKYSAGNLGEPNRQSSSESQSETGFAVSRPLTAKALAYDNYSDSDGDRGDIYDDREKLQGLLLKGDGGTPTEKNLTRRNVTTNTGGSNEFQKIERKKNRRASSPPKLTPTTDRKKKESRFDLLASSPKNRKNQQAEGMGMSKNQPFGSPPGFRSIKLNNEDAVEAQYRSKSETRKTAYINNDLTCDEEGEGEEEEEEEEEQYGERKTRTATAGGVKAGEKGAKGPRGKGKRRDESDRGRRKRKGHISPLLYWIGVVFWTVASYCRGGARWFIDLITDIGCQLWDITVHCSKELYTKVTVGVLKTWYRTGDRLRNFLVRLRQRDWRSFTFWRRKKKAEESWGLDENITLPATGEEAMRRLLSCRGQDAYSILGLRADCTDEDIKRYYKRQAVLVHPDKNVAYGAEEAFKILHHAYGMIDKPETRESYNMGNLHRTKEMQELEELLEKLRQKVEEALSTMHCDCGNKHRRFVTKRTVSEARYCKRCKDYHSARENDIWAESQWFGFLWYYYACMDNAIYDITEWAGCPKNLLKHMKPNSHLVQYRLITGHNARKHNSPGGHNRPQSDADVDAIFGMLDKGRRGNFLDKLSPDLSPPSPGPGDLFGPQSASYRPPSFSGGDSGRPRKAGRRRKK